MGQSNLFKALERAGVKKCNKKNPEVFAKKAAEKTKKRKLL